MDGIKMSKQVLPKRKNPRLKNYDYSLNGCYFVTFCVKDRKQIFGEIRKSDNEFCQPIVALSDKGKIVDKYINSISKVYKNVFVDNYVIMPDHVHLLISIEQPYSNESNNQSDKKISVSTIIKSTKSLISKELNDSIWQKSFFDEIIDNEKAYEKATQYIDDNPVSWFLGKHSYEDKL